MNAVAPITPSPAPEIAVAAKASQSDSGSTFAPELKSAIDGQKNTSQSDTLNTDRKDTGQSEQSLTQVSVDNKDTEIKGSEEQQDFSLTEETHGEAGAALAMQATATQDNIALKLFAEKETSVTAHNNRATLFSQLMGTSEITVTTSSSGENAPPTLKLNSETLQKAFTSETNPQAVYQNQTKNDFRALSSLQNSAKSTQASVVSTVATTEPSAVKELVLNGVAQLNTGDSVTWSAGQKNVQAATVPQGLFLAVPQITEITDGVKVSALTTESVMAQLTDLSLEKPSSPRNQSLSLRQEIANQYIGAKISQTQVSTSQETNGQNLENTSSGDSKENSQTLPGAKITTTSDQGFTQTLQQTQPDKAPLISETVRPGALSFTSQVLEDNIIQQVSQKFRTNQLLNDSKLVLKLHPAELGELKIDIHIKDGAVNASILAQSNKVQEILEKNMPRLKTILEENGLTINEIVVKVDSDVTRQFNAFEEQMAKNDNGFSKKQSGNSAFSLEDMEGEDGEEQRGFRPQASESGVNLTI